MQINVTPVLIKAWRGCRLTQEQQQQLATANVDGKICFSFTSTELYSTHSNSAHYRITC
jgi:hypothetical protein